MTEGQFMAKPIHATLSQFTATGDGGVSQVSNRVAHSRQPLAVSRQRNLFYALLSVTISFKSKI
jgi:hypothetical protein